MRQKERISTLGNCLFRVTFSFLSTSLLPEMLSGWILAEQSEMLLFFSGRVEGRATQLTADHSKQSHPFSRDYLHSGKGDIRRVTRLLNNCITQKFHSLSLLDVGKGYLDS